MLKGLLSHGGKTLELPPREVGLSPVLSLSSASGRRLF